MSEARLRQGSGPSANKGRQKKKTTKGLRRKAKTTKVSERMIPLYWVVLDQNMC